MIRLSDVLLGVTLLFLILVIFWPCGCMGSAVTGASADAGIDMDILTGPATSQPADTYGRDPPSQQTTIERKDVKLSLAPGTHAILGQRASARNADIVNHKGEIDLSKVGPATANLPNMLGAFGGAVGRLHLSLPKSSAVWILFVAGILLIAAGVAVWIWLKQPGLGLALAGAGVLVVVLAVLAEKAVWVYVVLALVGVGLGVYFAVSWWRGKRAQVTLPVVTSVVEAQPAAVQENIKSSIAATAGKAFAVVKKAVTVAKAKGVKAVIPAKKPTTKPTTTTDSTDTLT